MNEKRIARVAPTLNSNKLVPACGAGAALASTPMIPCRRGSRLEPVHTLYLVACNYKYYSKALINFHGFYPSIESCTASLFSSLDSPEALHTMLLQLIPVTNRSVIF